MPSAERHRFASRALERMMGKGMTGIITSKLKGAIDLAKAKGLNVKGAEQMAPAAPAAQAALKALEEALAPDDLLEIDTVKVKELLEAARKAKAPEKELAVCEERFGGCDRCAGGRGVR